MNLNQVTLRCSDLERSILFYQTFGLRLIVKNNHYARFECPQGEATFSLEVQGTPVPGTGRLYFECEALDQRCQELQAKGLPFVLPPADKPWRWREAFLQDPDGYEICLFYAGENRKNPPWRIQDAR